MPDTFTADRPSCIAAHLDLKGLPPTETRLLALPALFRAAGYNAVLVEWEDMFPWSVDERFRGPTCYTRDTIRAFAAAARDHGLELIPLVQCLGHMETPLRHDDYAHLREQPDRCDCLNPLAEGARELIESMIDDVLELTPDVRRFHLGGDEAWAFATNPQTRAFADDHGKDRLYLRHLDPLLDRLIDRGVRPLLWHDMMIEWSDEAVAALAEKADLVVWGYVGHPDAVDHHFNTRYTERFHGLGVRLWGAGAYKGAEAMDADLPDLAQRMANAEAWRELHGRFRFEGLIATAWSRFSTHRMQNEPIAGSLDALVRVGRLWCDGQDPGEAKAMAILEQAGEHERFARCREALQALSQQRAAAWQIVRETWENIALVEHDPTRTGSGIVDDAITRLHETVPQLAEAGRAAETTLAGLVDARWLDEYVAVRVRPLERQVAMLRAAAPASAIAPIA